MENFNHNTTTFGIRNRILIFALMFTLIPSLGLGWVFYTETKRLLEEKVELELHNISNLAQREAELWFKDSAYNIRVFSNSFVISENLEHFINLKQHSDSSTMAQEASAIKVITEYLMLVQSQFQEYQRLLLLDDSGKIITQSSSGAHGFTLPADWKQQIEQHKMVIGEAASDGLITEASFFVAVPVFSHKQEFLGLLVAESSIGGLEAVMKSVALSRATHLLLLNREGLIISSTIQSHKSGSVAYFESSLKTLYANPMHLSTYMSSSGIKVIGLYSPLPHLSWGIVMEKNFEHAFAEVLNLKNVTLISVAILLMIVGVAAFFLSYSILSPLKILVNGALQVASGDLDVKLPITKRDELGFTMSVFNDMVVRLRKNHEKLEMLATVDSLTGLFNRKHLMDALALHMERYARNHNPFSILMADLDYFKQVNDRYGHLAGDAVLIEIGKIFQATLRSIDTAGRYGGEEFLIILDNSQEEEAEQTAERIRKAVEESTITVDGKTINVTLSIGVATINELINTDRELIGKADLALYEAKKNGRNRVVRSTSKSV